MQNSLQMDSVVATSEPHYDDVLVSGCRQLPSVAVECLAEHPHNYTDIITPQTTEGANPVDAALKHSSMDVLTFKKHAWLMNRYVWFLLIFVLVAAIVTALVAMSGAESNCALPAWSGPECSRKLRFPDFRRAAQDCGVVPGKHPIDRQHIVVCYVASWAHWRPGLGKFTVEDIDPRLCTHLVYAFAVLNMKRNAIESVEPAFDLEENNGTGGYRKMTSLKRHYRHLKVLLSMGGWAERMEKNYSEVAESPSRRKALITSVSEFLRKYNFDGLDLHWQYPAEQNGVPADKENFVSLLKEFREEFDKYDLLLTVPLGVLPDTIEHSYDLPALSQYVHYMFALCYAYYGHWGSLTGPNAPLYPRYDDDNLNVESCINILLRKGADPNKLVLGLPLYGRIFKLKNSERGVGFEKESEGAGMQGPYVQELGLWGYNEICWKVDNPTNNWKKYWDYVTYTPYASKGNQFISYDDANSLTNKVELALLKKLAGVVAYSLDMDDYRGSCTFGRSGLTGYPLMRAINNALDKSLFWEKFPCSSRSSATGPVD